MRLQLMRGLGYAVLGCTIIFGLVVLAMRQQIRIAIEVRLCNQCNSSKASCCAEQVIKEAAHALLDMPAMLGELFLQRPELNRHCRSVSCAAVLHGWWLLRVLDHRGTLHLLVQPTNLCVFVYSRCHAFHGCSLQVPTDATVLENIWVSAVRAMQNSIAADVCRRTHQRATR